MSHKFKKIKNVRSFGEDPRVLLHKFLLIGLLCVSVLLALTTYAVYRVYNWCPSGNPGFCQAWPLWRQDKCQIRRVSKLLSLIAPPIYPKSAA
jgi:hypothetical protein